MSANFSTNTDDDFLSSKLQTIRNELSVLRAEIESLSASNASMCTLRNDVIPKSEVNRCPQPDNKQTTISATTVCRDCGRGDRLIFADQQCQCV